MSPKRLGLGLVDSCWRSLLRLAGAARQCAEPVEFGSFRFGDGDEGSLNSFLQPRPGSHTVSFTLGRNNRRLFPPTDTPRFHIDDFIRVSYARGSGLPLGVRTLIQGYLPYCFGSVYARKWGRAFAVTHLAQSLDGKIATLSGDSNWIGSRGNFLHAHRMRALCDSVLIGSKTLRRDHPQLTVRHVRGDNPKRIVLGSSGEGIESLTPSRADPVLLIGTENGSLNEGVRTLPLPRDNGFIPTLTILKALFDLGIYSVYIEGGGLTASRFLEENMVDVLQLHISPMIIGSGVSSFSLPPAQDISSSVHFRSHYFVRVDDAVMLIATLEGAEREGSRL